MNSKEIRALFLDFFKQKSHQIVPSAPLVLKNDPSLMFVNAGMNPFKSYFLGNEKAPSARIADTQKCLRVSGKHNDLEDVGIDTYHHTLFEMLGNWSFGDPTDPNVGYFKKEAIAWAWELLTEVYKIDKNSLYVTIFEGDASEGLEKDTEAYEYWKAWISEDRILLGNKKDNFWEMGDQGPCGPCSEIHVDIRSEAEKAAVAGHQLVNQDHPQVVEIWNLVFIQYNRKADGKLENLPAKHIDTGMGFERLCMVLQGKTTNYETDVFTPLIQKIEAETHQKYTLGKTSPEAEKTNIAIRVIADHIRAVSFAIADGQLPSNTGAGYVIRRILRRAIRYGFSFLNAKEAFLHKLVATLTAQMGEAFPELTSQQSFIENVIREEENNFLRTLEMGLQLLENLMQNAKDKTLSGQKAFELFDTYGFPKDLTALILKEKGWQLDEAGFEAEMAEQKNRSRAASQVSTEDWVILQKETQTDFVGYDHTSAEAQILRYRKVASKKEGVLYQIVLDKTPFYPEGGGQVGDSGKLIFPNETIEVLDTKKENSLVLHITQKLPQNPKEILTAQIDVAKRVDTAKNHTATHLLHHALRLVLGEHVTQKGSLVNDQHLRFDFAHFAKLSVAELAEVERLVNLQIDEKLALQEQREASFEDAVAAGAMALFGEKYGDKVRSIQFGQSVELCGGTHVPNSGDIWHFKIVSEGAVAAGIRRIEAITGRRLKQFYEALDEQLHQIKSALKNPQDAEKAIVQLQNENLQLKKQLDEWAREKALLVKADLEKAYTEINGVLFLAKKLDLAQQSIKDLVFDLGQNRDNLFVLIATESEGKAMLTCYISKPLAEARHLDAGKVVRELGKLIHGGGGGQPFFATAGGKSPGGIPKALERAKDYVL
jgi:alanyl-tRNA synthetase